MLFHDVLCMCFLALLAPKIETKAQLDPKTRNHIKPEALFADVIKNISRVNTELQNLIKNYEQFQEALTSQEDFTVKKAYVSDSEGGRVNRNSNTNKGKPLKERTTNSYPTKMIFMEDDDEKSSETEESSETKTSSQKQKSDEVETSHEEVTKKPIENTVKNNQTLETNTTEKSTTNKVPKDTTPNKKEIEPKIQDFSDIHNNMKIQTNRLKRIVAEAYQDLNQTKYVESEKQTKYLNGETPQTSESEISAEGKLHKEVTEEEVDKKIMHERAFEEKQVPITAGVYLRSALRENTMTTTKNPVNVSLESTDNDEDLSKEMFKTNVLRQAYGDACLKLVIRKCYKACTSSSKIACRAAIKCKEEFKTYFKEKAKTKCLEEFRRTSLRRIAEPKQIDGGVTQEGYLSVACQTSIRRTLDSPKPTKNNTEPLNILRDKYERACTKISQKKCTNACHNALDTSCDKHECNKRLKKNFKKHCRMQCKKNYSSKSKGSGSGSDSDDYGDSDDNSDNDDDSDSDDSDEDSSDDDDDTSNSVTSKNNTTRSTKTPKA